MNNTLHPSRMALGWACVKSAFRTLRRDTRLLAVPIISALCTGGIIGASALLSHTVWQHYQQLDAAALPLFIAIILTAYVLIMVTTVFFEAVLLRTISSLYTARKCTLSESFAATVGSFWPLAIYGVCVGTIGVVLRVIEQIIPFASNVIIKVFDGTVAVATYFAVPVIALRPERVNPLRATKESVKIIGRTWGQSATSVAAVGIIGLAVMVIYLLAVGGAFAFLPRSASGISIAALAAAAAGYLVIMLIWGVVGSIVKAALYHFATTGETPSTFDKRVLTHILTSKKATKIFS